MLCEDYMTHEKRIAALTLILGAYTTGLPDAPRCRHEFLHFVRHRWGLTEDQANWSRELLEQTPLHRTERQHVLASTAGLLTPADRTLFHDLLCWFSAEPGLQDTEALARFFPPSVLSAFAQLRLPPTLDRDLVRRVFRESMRLFHPDAQCGLDLSENEKYQSEQLAREIIAARHTVETFYDTLAAVPENGS